MQEYVCALMKHEGVDADLEGKISPCTQRIIDDLLDIPLRRGDGSGVMVLIRVSPEDGTTHGEVIKKRLDEAREKLGLESRFTVVLDVHQKTCSLSSEIGKPMLERLQQWNAHGDESRFEHVNPTSYEHLLDLPIILILCEKGKMGAFFSFLRLA